MSNLKPCPHCGELPDIVETSSGFQALCSGCDMATYSDDWTEKTAIEIWNARHDGWISVDDRLPDDNQVVLLNTKDYGVLMATFIACDNGSSYFGCHGHQNDLQRTHWMPLPEPPND